MGEALEGIELGIIANDLETSIKEVHRSVEGVFGKGEYFVVRSNVTLVGREISNRPLTEPAIFIRAESDLQPFDDGP